MLQHSRICLLTRPCLMIGSRLLATAHCMRALAWCGRWRRSMRCCVARMSCTKRRCDRLSALTMAAGYCAARARAVLKADAVVLACGAALKQFEPAAFLPITLSRGQIEWGPGRAPAHALTRGSYVAPFNGGVLFGATFDNLPEGAALDEQPTEEARARNAAALAALAPDVAASLDANALTSRVSHRATTPDRAPIAGLLPDAPAWLAQYEGLAHGRAINTNAPPPAHAGVYVLGGFGARGLTLAPLLAERIAAEMCGDIMPLPKNSLDAIHPARFLHRALKRR